MALTLCPGGGIGRRRGLKIPRLYGCAGSTPASGTSRNRSISWPDLSWSCQVILVSGVLTQIGAVLSNAHVASSYQQSVPSSPQLRWVHRPGWYAAPLVAPAHKALCFACPCPGVRQQGSAARPLQLGLRGVIRGKVVRPKVSDKALPCPQDWVKRQFGAPHPNARWLSDFAVLYRWQGLADVAVVIDVFALRISGWRRGHAPTAFWMC